MDIIYYIFHIKRFQRRVVLYIVYIFGSITGALNGICLHEACKEYSRYAPCSIFYHLNRADDARSNSFNHVRQIIRSMKHIGCPKFLFAILSIDTDTYEGYVKGTSEIVKHRRTYLDSETPLPHFISHCNKLNYVFFTHHAASHQNMNVQLKP